MRKKILFSLSIFALGVISVSAYTGLNINDLNIKATDDGDGVNINGLNIESTGNGGSVSTGNSDIDINSYTNTQKSTSNLNISNGESELNLTGTTNSTGNNLNINGGGSNLNITGNSTGGSNTGSIQIQADSNNSRDVYQNYRDVYQDGRDLYQDFRDGNVNVSTNSDGSVTLKSQNGSLMITTDEDGGTSELKITGTPTKLSIIAEDPEAKRLTLSTVANMNGDAHLLIQDDSDLRIYSDYVIEAQPKVKKVSYGNNTVEIAYKQDARFLGIFGTYLNGRIIADTNAGKVEVKLPWYSFLFVKDDKPDEVTLTSKVSGGLNDQSLSITSGGDTLQIGAQRNAKTTGLIISAF